MQSTLRAVRAHPKLELQIVATGMHLSTSRGKSIDDIARQGWKIDRAVRWGGSSTDPVSTAKCTGRAIAGLAEAFEELGADVVLVVGDRVEAFAAASAGHISNRIVAHVHGGDRALGQVDDALRHAITKLAHVHFAATEQSARRIIRLGEDRWRVHRVGAPGIDGIVRDALSLSRQAAVPFALVVYHPVDSDATVERRRAVEMLDVVTSVPFERVVVVYPNNDPGSEGIIDAYRRRASDRRFTFHRNVSRPQFLGLMRDAAVMVGNSSSGIIEAASFGTPVIDIGLRQAGRERSQNVTNVPYGKTPLKLALTRVWNDGYPKRFRGNNVYGGDGAGRKIAQILAGIALDDRTRRKLIAY